MIEEGSTPKKRRSRPGKCARRRRRKARAILEAADAAAASSPSSPRESSPRRLFGDADDGDNGRRDGEGAGDAAYPSASATAPAVVPCDREYALEGVKVRRREERKKRRQVVTCQKITRHDGNAANQGDASDGMPDDGDNLLDPRDQRQLRSQLGFVPGNAVCVAARLSGELLETEPVDASKPSSDNNGGDCAAMEITAKGDTTIVDGIFNYCPIPPPPSVIKLYPMAVRESYRGGKTDGRAFKGRRRGAMRMEDKKHEEGGGGDTSKLKMIMTEKKSKGERAWVVEPSSNLKQTNGDTASGIVKASNIQQAPPSQQIIEPFPTLYWLTSPILRMLISKLEISKDTNVAKMETRLRSSPNHLAQMERAHESYGRNRWEFLTPQDRENIIKRGWKGALDESRGVAGIRRRECVKCLHAHAAHYLAQVAEKGETVTRDAEGRREGGMVGSERTIREPCDSRDDLNLVGKWTMEAVLDLIKFQKQHT